MDHKSNLMRGDIIFAVAKTKSNDLNETNGRYAVVLESPKSKQKYVDVVYIDNNQQCAKAFPIIWHSDAEATVQCGRIERIDRRRVLYVDGHCSKKEMMRIRSGIIGGYGLKTN